MSSVGVSESTEELEGLIRESLVVDMDVLSVLSKARQAGFGLAVS